MGRTKRFSILNAAIKKYSATGGAAITAYKTFKTGTSAYTVNGTPSLGRDIFVLLPFGVKSTDPKVLVQGSERAFQAANLTAAGLALADLNLTAPTAAGTEQEEPSLVPAKVIVKSGMTAASTTKISKITTLSYKSYGGSSATYPFGQGAAAEANLVTVQSQIAVKVAAGGANRSVTFTPERFYY